jgi:hypothetical protein
LTAVGPDRFKQVAFAMALAVVIALIAVGCGGGDDSSTSGDPASAPAASNFPAATGTLEDVLAKGSPADDIVVSPSTSIYTVGKNRLGLGIFNVDGSKDDESADVAVYIAHAAAGQAQGPFPATRESLVTPASYTSQTTSTDPDAAKAVYVVHDLPLTKPGEWRVVAAVTRNGKTEMARVAPSMVAYKQDPAGLPGVGDQAPVVHTPTVDDVGDIKKIDTRVPPDTMHNVDLADVLGKKPVVIVFATPALCQSRVCGPVVDIEEQVKAERPDDAAYIHEEIYQGNNPNNPITEPFAAYQPKNVNLQSEPWLFVINSDGTVSTRIQGAFSKNELDAALDKAS